MMNVYKNDRGDMIRATNKAYHLYYEKIGFRPVSENMAKETGDGMDAEKIQGQDVGQMEESLAEKEYENMTVQQLKDILEGKGIPYTSKDRKEDLLNLLTEKEG